MIRYVCSLFFTLLSRLAYVALSGASSLGILLFSGKPLSLNFLIPFIRNVLPAQFSLNLSYRDEKLQIFIKNLIYRNPSVDVYGNCVITLGFYDTFLIKSVDSSGLNIMLHPQPYTDHPAPWETIWILFSALSLRIQKLNIWWHNDVVLKDAHVTYHHHNLYLYEKDKKNLLAWCAFNAKKNTLLCEGIIQKIPPFMHKSGVYTNITLQGHLHASFNLESATVDRASLSLSQQSSCIISRKKNVMNVKNLHIRGVYGQNKKHRIDYEGMLDQSFCTGTARIYPHALSGKWIIDNHAHVRQGIDVKKIFILWPEGAASYVRSWIEKNFQSGRLHGKLTVRFFYDYLSFSLQDIRGYLLLEDSTLSFWNKMEPVKNLYARSIFDHEGFAIHVQKGTCHAQKILTGRLAISPLIGNSHLFLNLVTEGNLSDLMKAVKNIVPLDNVPLTRFTGHAKTVVDLEFPLGPPLSMKTVKMDIQSTIKRGACDIHLPSGLILKAKNTKAKAHVTEKTTTLFGTSDVDHIPTKWQWKKHTLTVDAHIPPAYSTKFFGFSCEPWIKNPVPLHITFHEHKGLRFDANLRHVYCTVPIIDWEKKCQQPLDGVFHMHDNIMVGTIKGKSFAGTLSCLWKEKSLDTLRTTIRLPETLIDYVLSIQGKEHTHSLFFDGKALYIPYKKEDTSVTTPILSPPYPQHFIADIRAKKLVYGDFFLRDPHFMVKSSGTINAISDMTFHNIRVQSHLNTLKGLPDYAWCDFGRFDPKLHKHPEKSHISRFMNPVQYGTFFTSNLGTWIRNLGISEKISGGHLKGYAYVNKNKAIQSHVFTENVSIKSEPLIKMLAMISPTFFTEFFSQNVQFRTVEADIVYDEKKHVTLKHVSAKSLNLGLYVDGKFSPYHNTIALKGTVIPGYLFNTILRHFPIIGRFIGEKGIFSSEFAVKGTFQKPQLIVHPLSIFKIGFLKNLSVHGQKK